MSRNHWAVMTTLDSSNRSLLSDDGSSALESGGESAEQQRIRIQANTILVKIVTGFLFMMLFVAILDLDMEAYAFDEQRPAFTRPVVISIPPSTPWQNPVEEGLYKNHTLDSVLDEIDQLKSFIWNTWDISKYPNFLKTMHVPTRSYDLQVLKFQRLLLQSHDKSFVMGITGSSVTAGHDNFFNESYPAVIENALLPIFKIMNISLVVRNAALGNNPCLPYDACISNHVGSDLDFLSWEQSMNCGRESAALEVFTRSALYMHKKPTVLYTLSGTPSWEVKDCMNSNLTLANHTQDASILTTDYKTLLNTSHIMNEMTFLKSKDKTKQYNNLYEVYHGLAPMGQNVVKLQEYKCQGPYTPDFSMKSTGKGSSWHPGRRGHMLRAHSILYPFLSMLSDAVVKVRDAKRKGGKEEMKLFADTSLEVARAEPTVNIKPVSCDPTQECGGEPKCFTDFEPRRGGSIHSQLAMPMKGWDLNVSFFDRKAVETAEREHRGYLDKKMVYISQDKGKLGLGENTSAPGLMVRIEVSRNSSIWICELQKGFMQYPGIMGDLDKESIVSIYEDKIFQDKSVVDNVLEKNALNLKLSLIPYHTSANIPKGDHVCFATERVPRGSHILSIRQKGLKQISVAYIIYW